MLNPLCLRNYDRYSNYGKTLVHEDCLDYEAEYADPDEGVSSIRSEFITERRPVRGPQLSSYWTW